MNRDEFWYLINQGKSEKTTEKALSLWKNVLSCSPEEDIFTFYDIFHTYFRLADREHLFAAATIIFEDKADESFDGFRAWIIAQGEQAYRCVLAEPEYLIEICSPGQNHRLDALLQIPYEAFFQKRGITDNYQLFSEKQEYMGLTPIGKNLLEEDIISAPNIDDHWNTDDLPFIFPRLYEKFH